MSGMDASAEPGAILTGFAGGLIAAPPPRLCYASPMLPLSTVNQWIERVRDRERAGTFARFLARRFLDDRLFQAAAALAYTTIFALVPLAIVVLGVLSAFPVFGEWRDQLTEYIFSNFVPSAASAVKET